MFERQTAYTDWKKQFCRTSRQAHMSKLLLDFQQCRYSVRGMPYPKPSSCFGFYQFYLCTHRFVVRYGGFFRSSLYCLDGSNEDAAVLFYVPAEYMHDESVLSDLDNALSYCSSCPHFHNKSPDVPAKVRI